PGGRYRLSSLPPPHVGCAHLGNRTPNIQTSTNTCGKQLQQAGFTPEPLDNASESGVYYPPFPRARSRSAPACPNADSGPNSRALRKAALASSFRLAPTSTSPRL